MRFLRSEEHVATANATTVFLLVEATAASQFVACVAAVSVYNVTAAHDCRTLNLNLTSCTTVDLRD
jgi:hypothetical protein